MIEIITILLGTALFLTYFGYYLLMINYSRRGKNWRNDELFPKLSIIIPTYNEEVTINTKLENILEQEYPRELLELVIIDSGSTDKTVCLIEEFIKNHPEIKVIFLRETERRGKTHAINIAYSKSSGEIKIISDADALLDKNAIRQIVGNFKDPEIGAVTGRQILINPEESTATRVEKSYRSIYQILRVGESILDSTPIFHGELSAYRSSLIEHLPENKSADDSRLANVIRTKGYRAVYDSDAVFYEYAPPSFRARFIQKVRRAQGLIRIFWDFKGVLFRSEYGKYGLVVMPIEFFMHCVSPILVLLFLTMSILSIFRMPFVFLCILGGLMILTFFSLVYSKGKGSVGRNISNVSSLVVGFLSSQLILLVALLLCFCGKSLHKWQKIDKVRDKERWRKFEITIKAP